ncbi:MAG TPA: ZIP family metal transporter [Pyrinomonadaceae bacterium]|nr:ZIP family metal transporter [Pyrinomonadaceae bacterium]
MNDKSLQLITFTIAAIAANFFGGLILFPSVFRNFYQRWLRFLLAISAGFMLSVSLLEVIPRTLELWEKNGHSENALFWPMFLVLLGYLLTQFFEHTVAPHVHLGEEFHEKEVISTRTAYTTIGGLFIHTFLDGVSIAAAVQLDPQIGLLVFLSVFLHKIPEGFTAGSIVLAAGKGRKQVAISTFSIGLATAFGVALFVLLGNFAVETTSYALPLAAGVSVYVAASDLIPEINHHGGKTPLVSLAVLLGVGLFFLLHLFVFENHAH